MLITDKNALAAYTSENRVWQGIASLEVTDKGRIFFCFYSGGVREEVGNYSMLVVSDDGGKSFSEPIAVAYREGGRCYDPCLWIDPTGRLWFTWSTSPEEKLYAVICDDPDADELSFSEPFIVGEEVMMNKPTVLSGGEWIFPISVWKANFREGLSGVVDTDKPRLAYAYETTDAGKTFERLGGVDAPERSFDEHIIFEHRDGRLAMYIRTLYGIAVSYSTDGGKTWSEAEDSGLGGPCSRFAIRRLRSGRVLLINHVDFDGRNNLTALLSEDDGKTFPYKLLLDGRSDVSYPDLKEAADGFIYVAYDRERGGFKKSLEEAEASAREILFAKITEDDIIKGRLGSGSSLCNVVSKLGKYCGDPKVIEGYSAANGV